MNSLDPTAHMRRLLTDLATRLTREASYGNAAAGGLDNVWSVNDRHAETGNFRLVSSRGPAIRVGVGGYSHVRGSRNEGRIEFGPVWPLDNAGQSVTPRSHEAQADSITVAATRTTAAIGDELLRRFLPKYLVAYAEQRIKADGHNAYEAARLANLHRLVVEAGATLSTGARSGGPHVDFPMGNYVHGVEVSDTTMSFDVRSVPMDVAIQILNLVHGRKADPSWDTEGGD